jgi:rubrerythrin
MTKQMQRQEKAAPIGKNRTGIALSPIDKQDMLEVTELTVPSMEGDDSVLANARAEYIGSGELIGSVPPPATVKGIAKTGLDAMKGTNASVLIDKLGERLAFERTGTRLYGALVGKCAASPPLSGGPTAEDLREIEADERTHFALVQEVITTLGGDPTAVTPCADVAAVASMGVLQVITDPRMSLKQSLEAILIAELADNEGWALLIELVRAAGHEEIAARFEKAYRSETEHLAKVRRWLRDSTLQGAMPASKGKA